MLELLGYIATFGVGLVLGLMGGGGSILSIPILVYLFSLNVIEATGYALFMVGVTSLAGAGQRYQNNMIDLKMGLIFGLPSVLAVFITRIWIIQVMPEVIFDSEGFTLSKRLLILSLFSIVVIVASYFMITQQRKEKADLQIQPIKLILLGVVIGLITGLIGVGGGFLIIPALFFLGGLPMNTAVGTALLIISAKSLIGFVGDVMNLQVEWFFLAVITLISIFGIFTGNYLVRYFSNDGLKRAFGWFILMIGITVMLTEIMSSTNPIS